MKSVIATIIISSVLYSTLSVAEMLQASADGTVFLSTDSIEVKQNSKGKYVTGVIYVKENGERSAAPFAVSCGKNGGVIAFRQGNGKMGEEHVWKTNGTSAFDSISATACKVAGM